MYADYVIRIRRQGTHEIVENPTVFEILEFVLVLGEYYAHEKPLCQIPWPAIKGYGFSYIEQLVNRLNKKDISKQESSDFLTLFNSEKHRFETYAKLFGCERYFENILCAIGQAESQAGEPAGAVVVEDDSALREQKRCVTEALACNKPRLEQAERAGFKSVKQLTAFCTKNHIHLQRRTAGRRAAYLP